MSFPNAPPFEVVYRNILPPVTEGDIDATLHVHSAGVSWCLRFPGDDDKRGGYFFHLSPADHPHGQVQLMDFERRPLKTLDGESLARLINHCTGVAFDEASYKLVHEELNFRADN